MDPRFCCRGCATVHALLAAEGLDRFYALGGGVGQPVGNTPAPQARDWLPALLAAGRGSGGVTRLRLDIQGIHCAACVWLIEELWGRQTGGLQLDLNPSLGQCRMAFDADRLDIGVFLDQLERLGYRAAPASKRQESKDTGLLLRLGICSAAAMNAMMFAAAGYFGLVRDSHGIHELFRWLSLGLSTLALLVGGPVFFRAALRGLQQRVLHLDLPISLGMLLAWAGSFYPFFAQGSAGYFDTVTVFVALMLGGRYLQRRALARNRAYLLRNDGAAHLRSRVLRNGGLQAVPVAELAVGDELWLAPGDLVPVEGVLLTGPADLSLDWINGESLPQEFSQGAEVPAGAFLRAGQVQRLRATATAADSGLLQLLATPRGARDARAQSRFWRLLNKVYVLLVLGLAAAGGLIWSCLDPSRALDVSVAILVVTCPCALGIATPLAFDLALAWLRRRGVYVRSTGLLERAVRVRSLVFDKTGTLTWGSLRAESLREVPAELRNLCYSIASHSNHPVSAAVAQAVGGQLIPDLQVEELPGRGLRAVHDGVEYRLGSRAHVFSESPRPGDEICVFTRAGHAEGCFAIHEDLRPGFVQSLQSLQERGYAVHLLSGDAEGKVRRAAEILGIPPGQAQGGMSPEDKAAYLRRLDRRDSLMVGDGLNDAPAFEAAYCAGAASCERPVMPARADFFFLGGGSEAVTQVLAVADRLRQVVRRNLWMAGVYNLGALSLCFAGLMTPLLCALLMPLSSLVLVGHSAKALRADGELPGPRAPGREDHP